MARYMLRGGISEEDKVSSTRNFYTIANVGYLGLFRRLTFGIGARLEFTVKSPKLYGEGKKKHSLYYEVLFGRQPNVLGYVIGSREGTTLLAFNIGFRRYLGRY